MRARVFGLRAPVFFLLAACGGADPAPSVKVEMATPDALTMSDDAANDLTIVVSYDDGDGDLGGGVAAITDCRAEDLVTMLAIPDIAPPSVVKDKSEITGTLELNVDDVGDAVSTALPGVCAELGVAEIAAGTTVFCVVLTDAGGVSGAGDCTGVITLND